MQIKFLGHSSFLIDAGGLRLVIDPNFNDHVGLIPRREPSAFDAAELRKTNAVLISNAHFHRLDFGSFCYFPLHTQFIVPLGVGELIHKNFDFKIREIKDGGHIQIGDITIHATASLHHASRLSRFKNGLALHYLISYKNHTTLYLTDTPYRGSFFHGLASKQTINTTLVPIDHVCPDIWAMGRYLSPQKAIQACLDLKTQNIIPHSYGAFRFTYRAPDKTLSLFTKAAKKHHVDDGLVILKPGESFQVEI